MARTFIGLGSNVGDREAALGAATASLGASGTVLRSSRVYVTAPLGYTEQPPFLNQVVELETTLPPRALLARLKQIEAEVGRTPGFRNGPRVIDLDLLLYEDIRVAEPDLSVPHPRMLERAFVLRPLAELLPRLHGRPITEFLERVADQDAQPLPAAAQDLA